MISMDNHYTLQGEVFTVLTVSKPGMFPVLGYMPNGTVYSFTADGTALQSYLTRCGLSGHDILIQVIPYSDFKIDEPVVVRDHDDSSWERRHFAGVKNGKPLTWCNGSTKWASGGLRISWLQCRRPSLQELG